MSKHGATLFLYVRLEQFLVRRIDVYELKFFFQTIYLKYR